MCSNLNFKPRLNNCITSLSFCLYILLLYRHQSGLSASVTRLLLYRTGHTIEEWVALQERREQPNNLLKNVRSKTKKVCITSLYFCLYILLHSAPVPRLLLYRTGHTREEWVALQERREQPSDLLKNVRSIRDLYLKKFKVLDVAVEEMHIGRSVVPECLALRTRYPPCCGGRSRYGRANHHHTVVGIFSSGRPPKGLVASALLSTLHTLPMLSAGRGIHLQHLDTTTTVLAKPSALFGDDNDKI